MEINGHKLSTCGVTADGETVNLDLLDVAGKSISLRLPFEQVGALAMTLPQLLTRAVRGRTGSETARFVFSLGEWRVEGAAESCALIVTLKTDDGFEVSFGMPVEACRSLAWALKEKAECVAGRIVAPLN